MMHKNFLFALLMICYLICGIALSVIAPFFPPFAYSKGISTKMIGLIISANPVGAIIGSSILGKIITEV